ncbi:YHYH protein [Gilvimarinus agarilyticus]|uniref:YHYH protein n=1 Tax=Gilvimarinus sp. 2_MG-2023 TaxID=3062666 RepID=UPI001C0A1336|nr:YHYH protein [Gilvimarinus sp. 2_MG-2023]MBU2885487.1 YHYH protein [Gilvimarinus agarilyticus]MDO6570387.1 YHYH protein [Gilvimarinus sp. 2_MG-2023]
MAVCLSACGGSSTDAVDTDSESDATGSVNSSPVITLAEQATANAGAGVTLSASVSDADGDELTLAWSQTGGASIELAQIDLTDLSFTAPSVDEVTEFAFTLTASDGSDSATATISVSVNPLSDSDTTDQTDSSVWIINSDNVRAKHILEDDTGLGVLVNVQAVETVDVNGDSFTKVTSDGIPAYSVVVSQEILNQLQQRPRLDNDFAAGEPFIEVGDVVEFGQDIGYNSNPNCGNNAGYGYWPPGPDCPTQDTREGYLPIEPTSSSEVCETGLGKVGLWVNGSSIYNWGDGMSYNQTGDWYTLAPVAEQYDVDICGGHAASGDYHHHFYSSCLADMVGDTADGHSPLYGFAADGYPIYGPWQAENTLAVSAWVVRDYSADSDTGCADEARSCQLIDQYDVSQGTEIVSAGPDFDTVVTTLSGNSLVATAGYYREDFYWDQTLTAQGGVYLDQYNGHYDAERGYHYHITVTDEESTLTPAFPYIVGDRFAGDLADNSLAQCSTGVMGPPPEGAPPR